MAFYTGLFFLYVESQTGTIAGIRCKQTAHQSDAGCFTASIRPEKAVYFPSFDIERYIINNLFGAEHLAQIVYFDGKVVHGRLTLTGWPGCRDDAVSGAA